MYMITSTITEESILESVSFDQDYAVFAPEGTIELQTGIAFVTRTIEFCRSKKIRGLIVDVRGVIALKNPSVADKFWYTHDWAKAAGKEVAVALVANRDLIDPTNIGVTMAENAGLRSNVFDNMEDAVAWVERYL